MHRSTAIGSIVVLLVAVATVAALSGGVMVSGEVTINAVDGPTITFDADGETDINLQHPIPTTDTVEITTDEGTVVFSSSATTEATIDETEMLGTWTKVTEIDATNKLSIDPDDKQQIDVEGDLDAIEFRDVGVDDGSTDVIYSGDSGTFDLSVHSVSAEKRFAVIDSSTGNIITTSVSDSAGVVTFSDLSLSETEVEIEISPWEMTVFDETNPENPIDDTEITAEFFDLDGESITTETTTDGTIDLAALEDSTFAVQLSANGYYDRHTIIRDVFEKSDAWMLPDDSNIDVVTPVFLVDDETGRFDPTTSRVYIQRGLEIDGETRYRTIAAEEAGVDGYQETLQENIRYRVIVENSEGDRRTLGKFTAQDDATYTLVVEDVEFDIGTDADEVEWSASYEVRDEQDDLVRFNYTDAAEATTSIDVLIHERGDESNVLHDQTHTGPYGEFAIIEQTDQETEWTITWEATRDGSDLAATRTVGPRGHIDAPLEDRWRHTIAISMTLVIGGLASRANAAWVAVSVACVAGMFWYIAWLPAEITAGIIVLAFVFPAVAIARNGGGF